MILLFPAYSYAQHAQEEVQQADSLFRAKQYTQSLGIYQSLLNKNSYSNAMLLKMAYIQEGLNRPALCLYYLNLYQQAADDHQTADKMEELARKYRLEGYQTSDTSQALEYLQKNNLPIIRMLSVLILFFLALLVYQKRKANLVGVPAFMVFLFSICLVVVTNWGTGPSLAIISTGNTYLMSGPSAGASVVAIVEEGHRLTISGKEDVWLKVTWREKEAFIKETQVLPITL